MWTLDANLLIHITPGHHYHMFFIYEKVKLRKNTQEGKGLLSLLSGSISTITNALF